jgi:hypothetical protein
VEPRPQPCLRSIDEDLRWIDRFGVRGGRAVLRAFDPDGKSGAGAVSLDLVHNKYLANRLDDIPMRSRLEQPARFGPHAGYTLSIPFVGVEIDYVLTDTLAFAGVGSGVLARFVGGGRSAPGPLLAIDVAPQAMSAEAWRTLLDLVDMPFGSRFVERMMRWRDGHVSLSVEGTALVFAASGSRL